MRLSRTVIISISIAVLVFASAAWAIIKAADLGEPSAANLAEQTQITAAHAIEVALTAVPGIVVEVELDREDDRVVYEVEVLRQRDGREVEVTVDAITGTVLAAEED